MLKVIEQLGGDEWAIAAAQVYAELKPKLQTGSGLVRQVRDRAEEERTPKILSERAKFLQPDFVGDLGNLDRQVDDLATAILEANYECQQGIYYDFLPQLESIRDEGRLSEPLPGILDFLRGDSREHALARYRLNMIMARLAIESAGQSNKSNAGSAGEYIGEAVLNAAGLLKGKHFRTQYKSKKGSDTDIVIPLVDNGRDQDVEVFIAVQLSTNDRARLASSELKAGAQAYLMTGNGLAASKKRLQSIGHTILESYSQANIRLVCYGPEIDHEIARLEQALAKKKDEQKMRRLEYISSYAFSFTDFARRMRERYGPKSD